MVKVARCDVFSQSIVALASAIYVALFLSSPRKSPRGLYTVPETSGPTGQQLQPLVSAHNTYLRRGTGMGRWPDGTLHPTAQVCAVAEVPQLMHSLTAARLARLGHVARMPDESVAVVC
eukprot:364905-Chlamydomonas_euryale.AAC.17